MSDKKIVFVSFWTSKYKEASERLCASLDKLNLEHDIRQIPDSTWQKSVRYKPAFILDMLNQHKDVYALVWVDADGEVLRRPDLFWEIESDLAVRYLFWKNKGKKELLSGTMFVKNTEHVRAQIKLWVDELSGAAETLSCPEQYVLQQMIEGGRVSLTVTELPDNYCQILRGRERTGINSESVIVHYQLSRENRWDGSSIAIVNKKAHKSRIVTVKAAKKRVPKPTKLYVGRENVVKKPRVPTSITMSIRRQQISARRSEHNKEIKEALKAARAAKLVAGMRRRVDKMRRLQHELYGGKGREALGGVKGARVSEATLKSIIGDIGMLPKASLLDGCLSGFPVALVMGNSPTITEIDPLLCKRVPVIGCNRALRYRDVEPDFLFIADREPYCQERDSGRLNMAAANGTKIIISDSVFDPRELLRGPYSNPDRRAQPVPDFDVYIYDIGPKNKKWKYSELGKVDIKLPINIATFEAPIVSCQNVAGSMLQAAAIFGVQKIAVIGIEMKWESDNKSHFYGPGKVYGAYPQDGAIHQIQASLRQLKATMKQAGIEIMNLSPVKRSPFAEVFGNYPLDRFIQYIRTVPKFERSAIKVLKNGNEQA